MRLTEYSVSQIHALMRAMSRTHLFLSRLGFPDMDQRKDSMTLSAIVSPVFNQET